MANLYASLTELQARLGITDAADFSLLEAALESASRYIDNRTGRRFYTNAATGTPAAYSEVRYYTATRSDRVLIDDILSVTSLATDDNADDTFSTTWAQADYVLRPRNAAVDGAPYWELSRSNNGDYSFPTGILDGVKVTGRFGYCALADCPQPIREVCLIVAAQMYRLKDAPFGTSGSPEMAVASLDPSQFRLILDWMAPYRRLAVG